MDRFIYIRNTEDSAYVNSVSNFKGMGQGDASAKVELFFDAAASTASGNNFDKIILSVTNGKEKEAMTAIAGALAGSKSGSTAVIADQFGAKFCDDNILSVDSIALNTSATLNQVIQVESVTADDSLTAAESGKTFVFADAAATLTLPDSGAGDIIGTTYSFVSNFQGTGQKVVCADTTNEDLVGMIAAADNDDSNATKAWPSLAATGNASVNFNSVAQGHPGSAFTLTNIAADVWYVEGKAIQSGGSEATPFATT